MSEMELALQRQIFDLQNQIESLRTNIVYPGIWKSYTPTVSTATGTLTTVSASGKYAMIGKVVALQITITITTNGTGNGDVRATLPINNDFATIIAGREVAFTGKMLQAVVNNNTTYIYNSDGNYPGGDGYVLILSGIYPIA